MKRLALDLYDRFPVLTIAAMFGGALMLTVFRGIYQ